MSRIFIWTNSQDILSRKSKLQDNALKKKLLDICQFICTSLEEYTTNLTLISGKGET